MTDVSFVHGWTVEAPFSLGHPAVRSEEVDVVISVERGTEMVQREEHLRGAVVAEYQTTSHHHTLVDKGAGRYLFRFHDYADVHINLDARPYEVVCWPARDAPRDVMPLLVAGNVMSGLLLLHGALVLHASAVERDGRAVALVGPSGGGKSTLAAMACLDGANLVSDDVLRVDTGDRGVWCHRGADAIRLRHTSVALVPGVASGAEKTADGRTLFSPVSTPAAELPLDAVILPQLRRDGQAVSRKRLGAREAFFALAGHPRISNWQEPATASQHFDALTEVAERVPIFTVDVPWGIRSGCVGCPDVSRAIFTDPRDQ